MNYTHSCRIKKLAEVPPLRARFADTLSVAGIEGDAVDLLKLVFTELLNNSIEHGLSHGLTVPDEYVDVYYEITAGLVRVRVSDPSEGAVTEQAFQTTDGEGFIDTGRGAGLFLIREFTDEVHVRSGANGGTEIEVIKLRADGSGGGGA